MKIDNMDIVPRRIDVFAHLGIPFSRLVPEVYARFEQLFHCYNRHFNSSVYLPEDAEVYLKNDNGYAYGRITMGSFEEDEIESEDEEDDEESEYGEEEEDDE